jgi:hypothetical protein
LGTISREDQKHTLTMDREFLLGAVMYLLLYLAINNMMN